MQMLFSGDCLLDESFNPPAIDLQQSLAGGVA
jgi:hypothetical protein